MEGGVLTAIKGVQSKKQATGLRNRLRRVNSWVGWVTGCIITKG